MAELTPDDADLRALGVLDVGAPGSGAVRGKRGLAWQDEGYWLLLPLMLLTLWSFRRHALPVLFAGMFLAGAMSPTAAWAQSPAGDGKGG